VLGGFSGGRLTHWKVSWGLIVDHPWFAFDSLSLRWLRPLVGYGPDLFRFTYLLYSSAEGPNRFLLAPDHAHNYFIHQTVEQGFLGTISSLGIFTAVFLAGGHQLLRSRRQMDHVHKIILIALLSVLAGRGLEMMVGVAKVSDLTVLWVLLGLFAALPMAMQSPERRAQAASPVHPPARPALFPAPGVNRALWVWKLVVVILMVGTIANLTWTKGISYPRAAVQAGRALEYFNQGDLPSTLTAIDSAIETAPDVWVYYNWKALVLSAYRRDRSGPREPHCDTQTNLPYRLCLATLAHQSNLNGSSQRPFEFRARIALANSAANLDQDAESIRHYQDSLDMVPGSWGLRNNMASALLQLGKPDDALEALQESLEITAGSAASLEALLIRASVYANLGRYSDALADLDRVIEISPNNAPAHAGKAVAHAHLGQDSQAREAVSRAADLGANREALDNAIEDIKQRR
jgi:Tfp pilus assembly protein PilF